MKTPRSTPWASPIAIGVGLAVVAAACAGASPGVAGNNGAGGSWVNPFIPGLVSLEVTPASQSLALVQNGTTLTGTETYTAIGHMNDGTTQDVTTRVGWPSTFKSLVVQAGVATVTAPGMYTITAASGSVTASAQLVASFTGDFFAPDFTASGQAGLDARPSGGALSIAYPLDGAIFPPNLSPIYVQVSRNGDQTGGNQNTARLNFAADNVNVSYYGNCETADPTSGVSDPGTGCYVRLPLSFTQLFIAVSELRDIQLTARVGGGGSALAESNTINVAWANVPLSGGLYYWTTMTANAYPGYTLPAKAATGTGIQRYDFSMDGAAPELVYTDQGTPPTFSGSPASPSSSGGEGTCIGCHAISNDGMTMALTINGSNAAGLALLDIANKALLVVNPNPMTGAALDNRRVPNFAATTTFGPNGDMMVNMYQSQLHLTPASTFPLAWESEVVPSWSEYKGDPFWSQDGKYLVFTSFAVPDVLSPDNSGGVNGDMKRGGQIVIASAESSLVHDDAHVLVARESGVTSYYPVVSNDSQLIAFCRSTCSSDPNEVDLYGSGYGSQTCDGYDDSSATLWLTSPAGGAAPISLDHANGTGSNDNSWPRWSPDNGMFRGRRLYWLSFSSRRPYGLQVNTSGPGSSKPQLWFAAVLTGSGSSGDPSFAPVWLPNQNPNQAVPNGNHVPQWVKVAVVIPG